MVKICDGQAGGVEHLPGGPNSKREAKEASGSTTAITGAADCLPTHGTRPGGSSRDPEQQAIWIEYLCQDLRVRSESAIVRLACRAAGRFGASPAERPVMVDGALRNNKSHW